MAMRQSRVGQSRIVQQLAEPVERFQRFADKFHTSTPQLAELAKQAKPRLLVLYHYNAQTDHELFNDMASRYSGQFVIGRDLDVY